MSVLHELESKLDAACSNELSRTTYEPILVLTSTDRGHERHSYLALQRSTYVELFPFLHSSNLSATAQLIE